MLVVTRLPGELIRIGDDTIVEIVRVRGNKVRVGITSPRDIPVHRQEVYEQIQNEKHTKKSQGNRSGR